jgi:predicted ribosomally synthesized peptide with nif11-like leader
MSIKCAEQFVEEMKSNSDLREKMSKFKTCDSLKEALKSNGFDFNQNDLTKAMAACMEEMAKSADSGCDTGQECSNADFKMDETIQALISIGAATAANCIPCLEHYYFKSGNLGIKDELIQEAFEIGSKVKTGAALAIKGTLKDLLNGDVTAEQKECCKTNASCC